MKLSSILLPLLLSISLLLDVSYVSACGESLYRVGRGVTYRSYSAPLPANIIVYNLNQAGKAIADQLAGAGHSIYWVSSAEELETSLQPGDKAVLIVSLEDAMTINTTTLGAVRVLPLVDNDAQRSKQAADLYGRSVSSSDSLRTLLKTVHLTLRDA